MAAGSDVVRDGLPQQSTEVRALPLSGCLGVGWRKGAGKGGRGRGGGVGWGGAWGIKKKKKLDSSMWMRKSGIGIASNETSWIIVARLY